MEQYDILRNYIEWIFPQFKLNKNRFDIDIMWGPISIVRIYKNRYSYALSYYGEFYRHFTGVFPNDLEMVKTIIEYRLNMMET